MISSILKPSGSTIALQQLSKSGNAHSIIKPFQESVYAIHSTLYYRLVRDANAILCGGYDASTGARSGPRSGRWFQHVISECAAFEQNN